jgi:hypothetical protein
MTSAESYSRDRVFIRKTALVCYKGLLVGISAPTVMELRQVELRGKSWHANLSEKDFRTDVYLSRMVVCVRCRWLTSESF